jgi:MFS family permease
MLLCISSCSGPLGLPFVLFIVFQNNLLIETFAPGYINSFGVFNTYYTETLGETPSTISWVGSVQLWIVFVVSVFSGRALDAGLFLPSFLVGSIIQIVGIFTNSLCTEFWQLLLAQGLCTGLGSGIIFCPAIGICTTYFQERRALAVAIVSTGNSFGGAIYPVVVRSLLPRVGFAWTVRVLGFINLACLACAAAFMRPRLPPRKSGPVIEWQAFREIPYACMVVGMSLVFGGLFFTYYYVCNPYLCVYHAYLLQLGSYGREVIGMPYSESTNLIAIFNGVGIPVRLLTGWMVDKYIGPLNGMIPLLFLNGIFAFAWIAVKTRTSLYIFAAFYGLSAGAFQCLFPTTLTSLNKDLSKNGVRLGMAFSVFSFAGLTGPPIGGALLETNGGGRGGYTAAQLGVGLATFIGACLMVAARVNKEGWSLKIKC